MGGLSFRLKAAPRERLDISALTPGKLRGLAGSEIANLAIGDAKHRLTVGDVFDISGEASDTVKTKATEIAKEQADRVTAVAQNVMDAATVEARKQELTMESAKSAAGGVAAKVGRIVDAVGKGISKRTGNS